MDKVEKLGLYIHVPFCKQKCLYCDFFSCSNFDNSIFEKYFDSLIIELQIRLVEYCTTHCKERHIINTIYIGGGTPSVVPTYIYKHFFGKLFDIIDKSNIEEMTVEINPESIDEALIDYISNYEFARISLGVQTTNDISLAEVGRIAKCSDIDRALGIIKRSSIKNISVDFIHSLPHNRLGQSKKDIAYILDRISISHISLYFLEINDDHVMKNKWDSLAMAEDDSVADYLDTLEYMYSCGFGRYEVSNFAIGDKYRSLHNNHYWDLDDYIGIGLSACGCHSNIRYINTNDIEAYFCAIDDNALVQNVETLDNDMREKEFIFLSMRKTSGLDMLKYQKIFRDNFISRYANIIEKYKDYFIIHGNTISLTDIGMLHANTIISNFF